MTFKSALYTIIVLGLLSACGGKTTKAWFFTQGNCPECEEHIVEALQSQAGVDSVGWDYEMGLTVVKFDIKGTNPDRLQRALAIKGFTTQYYPGDTIAAKALPACCREAVQRKLKRREIAIPSH